MISGNSQQDVDFAAVVAPPILCCKDFNGDGKADIFWRNAGTGMSPGLKGDLFEWQLNGFAIGSSGSPGQPGTQWTVVGAWRLQRRWSGRHSLARQSGRSLHVADGSRRLRRATIRYAWSPRDGLAART
jgi:hypothetical protein